jgi:hypothetical protein
MAESLRLKDQPVGGGLASLGADALGRANPASSLAPRNTPYAGPGTRGVSILDLDTDARVKLFSICGDLWESMCENVS